LASEPLEVDVATVHSWLGQRPDVALIDCREPAEAEIASIPGAVLLPMSQWAELAPELEKLQGKQLVVHCHHGGRSLRVAHWLRNNGFPTAQSMAGGIDAWSQEIDPSLPRY
jgi:rhodanese-related sulfurtransferase